MNDAPDTMMMKDRLPAAPWCLAAAALALAGCSSSPTMPTMPDGSNRVTVNTAERIEAFQRRLEEMREYEADRVQWAKEVGELREQLAQLRSATMILAANAEYRAPTPKAMARGSAGVAPAVAAWLQPPPPAVLEWGTQPQREAASVLQRAGQSSAPVRVRVLPAGAGDASSASPRSALIKANAAPPATPVAPVPSDAASGTVSRAMTPTASPAPPAPLAPRYTDYSTGQLQIGVPRPAPTPTPGNGGGGNERIERQGSRLASRPLERPTAFHFDAHALSGGFAPSAAERSEIASAARAAVRIVIATTASAAAAAVQAQDHATEAREWLVKAGVDPARIHLRATRLDGRADAQRVGLSIEMDSLRAQGASADVAAADTSGRGGFERAVFTLPTFAIGVQ